MSKQPVERIDVFISSTSIDLPEYRDAVYKGILSLGLFPDGMETWPVTDEGAVEKCRRKVDDAEIYLGVFAHRYGWCPSGYDGKSITELEYDWATERGIPRLCFVINNDYPWPTTQIEHTAKDRLDAFKGRVKERIAGFFTTPDDLKAQVIAALAQYAPQGQRIPAAYLRWLHDQSKKSGLLHVLSPRDASSDVQPVTVDRVYTPLNTRRMIKRNQEGKLILEGARSKDHSKSRAAAPPDQEDKSSPLKAMEAANLHQRMALLGDPGSGKSTFVSFLSLCLTGHLLDPEKGWMEKLERQGWHQGEKLPVLIALRDFAQDTLKDATHGTAALIFRHIEAGLKQWKLEQAYPAIQAALEEGRALLLLDGLDEVPSHKRDLVRDAVKDFLHRCPKNRYIITCRILSYANPDWRIPGLDDETIAPFDKDKIDNFIGAWYTALQALRDLDVDEAETRVRELRGMLRINDLLDLAANPMLLTVMAVVHNHLGTLPRENARLYEECVKLLLMRWRPHDASALISELDVREDDLYRMLWEIAYDAHDKQAERRGAADISESDIIAIAASHLNHDLGKAQKFCDYIEHRAGLMIGRGAKGHWRVFTFPHRTFQEYLTGCYAANNTFWDLAPELARRGSGWREVLLLATGHLVFNQGRVDIPLLAVDEITPAEEPPQNDTDWRGVWLAGDMLLLIGVQQVKNTKKGERALARVRQRLVELVTGGQLPPVERAAAGRTLGLLGDSRRGVAPQEVDQNFIDWVDIPAGRFMMGSDRKKDLNAMEDEMPQHSGELPLYRISRYLITNAQFAAFIADKGYETRDYWTQAGWLEKEKDNWTQPRFWDDPMQHIANHPVNGVSWYEAHAFCRWLTAGYKDGKWIDVDEVIRLPTEMEWEKAARGTEVSIFPYGNKFDANKANVEQTGVGRTTAVGIFPDGASSYGLLDMSGNLFEWVSNQYAEYPYEKHELCENDFSRE